jgi:excisionase family DNA binding protein
VAEVATLLKLNPQTVRNWIDQGKLPALHVGRRVRIRRADFDALVDQGHSGSTPKPKTPAVSIWDGEVPMPVIPG